MIKKIFKRLDFIITIDVIKKVSENLLDLKKEDVHKIIKVGKFSGLKDGVYPLYKFYFEEEKYITSGKVEVFWTYTSAKQFKIKEIENILDNPILVNKNRTFQVNVGKEVLGDIIYRIHFIEELFSTKNITKWYVIPTDQIMNFDIDLYLKEHN